MGTPRLSGTRKDMRRQRVQVGALQVGGSTDLVVAGGDYQTFYVDSGTGASGNPGTTIDAPMATIDQAVGLCTANRGDVIYLFPGHAETVSAAAGLDLDVAGITIYGLGNGTDMPELTFTTTTLADVDIDAANVTIKGVRFITSIDNLAAMIDVNATDFTMEDCEFYESSATGLTLVDLTGAGANACDRARILNNRMYCESAGNWDRAIELGEVADKVEIKGNTIIGDFDDAGIHNPTGKVLTNLTIADNFVRNNQAGQHAIELVSACTGAAYGNTLVTNALATYATFGTAMAVGKNDYVPTAAAAGAIGTPAVPHAGSFVPGLGFGPVTKAATLASDPDDLYTVTGKCLITLMVGEVTSVFATTTSMSINTSTNATVIAISTDVVTDVVGTLYVVTGDPDEGLNGATGGAAGADAAFSKSGHFSPFLVNDDNIYMNLDGAGTGLVQWDLYYIPLEAGAAVTSSA